MNYFEIDFNLGKLTGYTFEGFLEGLVAAKEKGLYGDVTSANRVTGQYTVFLIDKCVPFEEVFFSIKPILEASVGEVQVTNLMEVVNAYNFINLQDRGVVDIPSSRYNPNNVIFYTSLIGSYTNTSKGASQKVRNKSKTELVQSEIVKHTTKEGYREIPINKMVKENITKHTTVKGLLNVIFPHGITKAITDVYVKDNDEGREIIRQIAVANGLFDYVPSGRPNTAIPKLRGALIKKLTNDLHLAKVERFGVDNSSTNKVRKKPVKVKTVEQETKV